MNDARPGASSRRRPARRDVLPVEPAARLPDGELVDRVSALVEQARESIAAHANATLTLMFWHVGRLIDTEVLASDRAHYGAEIVVTLSRQLAARYGRSFEEKNLRRMVAVELKVGEFDARFEGQMKLYLKWLDRYERQDDEQAPIGLIFVHRDQPRTDRAA